MDEALLRSLIWMDYRVAVLFTVFIPLTLLIWAFVTASDTIQRLMLIYWRVSSLFAITVFLMIGNMPVSFVTSLLAHLLTLVGLWFWVDLNEEIDEQPQNSLKLALTSWRWAMTVYMAIGSVAILPFIRCALDRALFDSSFCQVWTEAPLLFRERFLNSYTPGFIGFIGISGLLIYVIYFGYFVLMRLGKQGRSAIQH